MRAQPWGADHVPLQHLYCLHCPAHDGATWNPPSICTVEPTLGHWLVASGLVVSQRTGSPNSTGSSARRVQGRWLLTAWWAAR
jgi:hypothetical protein